MVIAPISLWLMRHLAWLGYSLPPPKSHQSTSSEHSWPSTDMSTAAVYVRIKAANLRKAPHFEIFSSTNSITPSNPPVPTVLPKTAWRKFTMTSLPFGPVLSSMAWASSRRSGQRHYSIQSTCTTALPTAKPRKLLSKATTDASQTCQPSSSSALVYV